MKNKIDYETLKIDKIISLDKNDYSISLSEKIIKLGEEIGEMSTAKSYLTIKEYVEETYDAFNIAIAVYNTVKDNNINIDILKHSINHVEADNKLESAIPIFYGKICASLLLKIDSNSKSRTSKNTDIESYTYELILLLASQLKYIMLDSIFFDEIVDEKLNKWELKQSDYIGE